MPFVLHLFLCPAWGNAFPCPDLAQYLTRGGGFSDPMLLFLCVILSPVFGTDKLAKSEFENSLARFQGCQL
jgi:hypothetical protein